MMHNNKRNADMYMCGVSLALCASCALPACSRFLSVVGVQGIDIVAGGRRTKHKTRATPKSENVYIRLLVKVRCATCCWLWVLLPWTDPHGT